MESFRHDGLSLAYKVLGSGPDLVLLHPFPSCHELWLPVAERLATSYRVILPDLRSHGRSGVPERAALMADYAGDLDALCRELKVGKALFAGISIGGYILFEFLRRYPQRLCALALLATKAGPDNSEAKTARLRSAEEVLERGTVQFIDGMMPKWLGETTRRARPDLVEKARHTMRFCTPQSIALAQRGMAERPDSTSTLATINVPTLLVGGEEDTLIPAADIQRMHAAIKGSAMATVPRAGHYIPLEAPDDCFRLLRRFCDQHAK